MLSKLIIGALVIIVIAELALIFGWRKDAIKYRDLNRRILDINADLIAILEASESNQGVFDGD